MSEKSEQGRLVARCAVCRGDILADEPHEIWEGGYYCGQHSLPHLRERARAYAASLVADEAGGHR